MKILNASHVQAGRRLRKKRGNVMAMVLATIFVLMTIVLALHHQQSVSRSALVRSEADLRFREARNFALREHFTGESSPWGLDVGVDLEDVTPETTNPIPTQYAKLIYQKKDGSWSGLPDLTAVDTAHAHRYLELKPAGFGGLSRGVKKGDYKVVETEIAGYAAYAPRGTVKLGEVMGWQNPSHDKDESSTDAASGVPAIIGASSDIEVDKLVYGEAHSMTGDVDIDSGEGIGFVGPLPLPAYQNDLIAQLDSAESSLLGTAANGDKTGLISDRTSIGDLLDIMFGGSFNPERLLSLHQAWKFPTPMIPGASIVVPGLVWEIWFHVPFQPDLGFSSQHDPDMSRLDEIATEQQEAGHLLEEANQKLEEAKTALDAAQAAYAANPSDANQMAVAAAQDEYDDCLDKIEDIKDFLEDSSEEAGDIASGKIGSGMSSLPETREEDPSGRDGQWGWNYSKTIGKMFDLVTSVIKGGDLKDVAESISENVRVVHYGPADEVPQFEWNGNEFVSRSTWTVPASRTLRYDGDMRIRGDLWLQRGTVMVVNGDLHVESPVGTPSISDAFAPSGRVFFEEGSSLVVSGDFSCQGSSQFGSIMVAGEPGEIHPISSALLVDGDVQIPNGIFASHTIADLVRSIGFPGVEEGANQVQTLLEQQAPLLSKLAGPFHLRNPYFARYATTFQMVTIPFPPAVIVTPIPTQKENLHVFAFRAETFAYTAGLNATLGENLYTQADWWPFGDGVVPMALNLDLGAAIVSAGKAQALASSAELDPETIENEVRGFVETLSTHGVEWAIKKGIQKLTNEAARILAPSALGGIMDAVNDIRNALDHEEDATDNFYQDFVSGFEGRIGDLGKDLLSDLLVNTNILDQDEYLKDYAGILVHGKNIRVGSDARQVSGMFIADQDLIIDADLTIGTVMSADGSIEVKDFLYYPYFNQASLYLPQAVPGDTVIDKAGFEAYGAAHDSGMAVQVGPPPVTHHVTSEGWE